MKTGKFLTFLVTIQFIFYPTLLLAKSYSFVSKKIRVNCSGQKGQELTLAVRVGDITIAGKSFGMLTGSTSGFGPTSTSEYAESYVEYHSLDDASSKLYNQCKAIERDLKLTLKSAEDQKRLIDVDDQALKFSVGEPETNFTITASLKPFGTLSCAYSDNPMLKKQVITGSGSACGEETVVAPIKCKDEVDQEILTTVVCVQKKGTTTSANNCYDSGAALAVVSSASTNNNTKKTEGAP